MQSRLPSITQFSRLIVRGRGERIGSGENEEKMQTADDNRILFHMRDFIQTIEKKCATSDVRNIKMKIFYVTVE